MFGSPRRLRDSARCCALMLLGAMVALDVAAAIPAAAHVHRNADGTTVTWYPMDCCHAGDCHPVSRLTVLRNGYLMTTEDGATLFVNSNKLRRPSRDGRWHVCFGGGEDPAVNCVFEPATS